jgi:hypothetical protein
MPEEPTEPNYCEHADNTTEMLVAFTANKHHRDERYYEVYCCRDCGRLFNSYGSVGSVMTPDEITQMFVDLYHHLIGEADEIQAQAKALYDKISEGLPDNMPKRN